MWKREVEKWMMRYFCYLHSFTWRLQPLVEQKWKWRLQVCAMSSLCSHCGLCWYVGVNAWTRRANSSGANIQSARKKIIGVFDILCQVYLSHNGMFPIDCYSIQIVLLIIAAIELMWSGSAHSTHICRMQMQDVLWLRERTGARSEWFVWFLTRGIFDFARAQNSRYALYSLHVGPMLAPVFCSSRELTIHSFVVLAAKHNLIGKSYAR